jgi:hypothetical protein
MTKEVKRMNRSTDSVFSGELEIVTTLSNQAIQSSLADLRSRDQLTIALRQSLRQGVEIDQLSAASGLATKDIRARVEGELAFGEDLDTLAGIR